jgi:hypothetical protein
MNGRSIEYKIILRLLSFKLDLRFNKPHMIKKQLMKKNRSVFNYSTNLACTFYLYEHFFCNTRKKPFKLMSIL